MKKRQVLKSLALASLAACGLSDDESRGGIRISFGRTNSIGEAERAAAIVAATCARIRDQELTEVRST